MEQPEPYTTEVLNAEDRIQQVIEALRQFRDVIERGDKVKVVINFAGDRCRVNIEYWEPKVI